MHSQCCCHAFITDSRQEFDVFRRLLQALFPNIDLFGLIDPEIEHIVMN